MSEVYHYHNPIPCKCCEMRVSPEAKLCPHCGQPDPDPEHEDKEWEKRKDRYIELFIMFLFFGLLFGCYLIYIYFIK